MTCTFFGHRDAPKEIEPKLRATLIRLIENKGVDTFYVGDRGSFDNMARNTLKNLKEEYPFIRYAVALSGVPGKRGEHDEKDYSDTFCPYVYENFHPKYAIVKRNRWLILNSDFVVTYVYKNFGGASQFKDLAVKKGKKVIELYNIR